MAHAYLNGKKLGMSKSAKQAFRVKFRELREQWREERRKKQHV